MTSRVYAIHGLRLGLSGEDSALNKLHARLGRFPMRSDRGITDLHFEFHKAGGSEREWITRPAGVGRSVLDPGLGEATYFEESGQLYLEIQVHGRALCNVHTGSVQVSYPETGAKGLWLLSHPLFTIPLAELLKHRGLYMLHAAGLAVSGRGLLIAGPSGAGKTTLTLALLRAGFDFLADDTVFLSAAGSGLRILAFPDEVDVTLETLGFFPELHGLARPPELMERRKHTFCATNAYEATPCWDCAPAIIIFPRPAGHRQSVITPMAKAEALMQLVCNVVRTERRSSQAHLDALAALVHNSRCFRLQTGRDFDQLPTLLRSLMDEPTRSCPEVR